MTFDGPSENIPRQAAAVWVVAGWVPGWHTVLWPPTQRRPSPTQITHSISSSYLQLQSLSSRVIVVQIKDWLYRLTSQLYVGLAIFDVTTRRTCSAGCKCINMLIKVDCAVWGCADLNDQDWIRSSHRFEFDLSRSDSIWIQCSNQFQP